ncbi:MAG: tyrosine-type recombinase/integrase [Acidobacteriaceae bacterium]
MLKTSVDRYISLRRTLGYQLNYVGTLLHSFADFANERGDTHIIASTAVEWATACSSPLRRHARLQSIVLLARFLHAEDPKHEIPPPLLFSTPYPRPLPYIYSHDELGRIVAAARRICQTYPLRRETYTTLFGLIAATGLRISEALDLQLPDVQEDGVLFIHHGKGGKSRIVPLHPTVVKVLGSYLEVRRRLPDVDDHLFLSAGRRRISHGMANYTFRRVLRLAGIGRIGRRACRIHDMRHTFATRSLEKCPHRREDVAQHFVALATYLGHTQIAHTYWYLEATPELMEDIAKAADVVIGKEGA